MMWLSQIYDKGLFGIKRNRKAAYKLHLRAATKGYPLARTMLSIKAEKNGQFQEALMLYNLACSGGCSAALKALIVNHEECGRVTECSVLHAKRAYDNFHKESDSFSSVRVEAFGSFIDFQKSLSEEYL